MRNKTIRVTYDPPESDPRYGEAGDVIERDCPKAQWLADLPEHIEALHQRARASLPAETVYELRGKVTANHGLGHGIAWYHIDAMKDREVTGAIPWPGKFNELGGYYLLGTFRT